MRPITFSFGFVPRARVTDLTGILLEATWLAGELRGFPFAVIGGDVEVAFDKAEHADLIHASTVRGMAIRQALALKRERNHVHASAKIKGNRWE